MQPEFRWATQAITDLADIYDSIRQENESAADRIVAALKQRTNMLLTFPRMGQSRPDISSSARCLVSGNYLILYRLDPPSDASPSYVQIVRVVDGRRMLDALVTVE